MRIIYSLLCCLPLFMLLSCEKKGACERYDVSGDHYFCFNDVSEDLCEGWDPGDKAAFYEDESCISIGYTEKSSGLYNSPTGRNTPGSGSKINSSGSGGSSSGGNCSESNYSGPSTTTYPQSAPYCKLAWYYRNCKGLSLASTEVSTNCNLYKTWMGNNSSLPSCSYCK